MSGNLFQHSPQMISVRGDTRVHICACVFLNMPFVAAAASLESTQRIFTLLKELQAASCVGKACVLCEIFFGWPWACNRASSPLKKPS